MFVEERQSQILELLRRDGKVSVEQLVEAFNVSAPTIRADLGALEHRRLLRRTHGGAIALDGALGDALAKSAPGYGDGSGGNGGGGGGQGFTGGAARELPLQREEKRRMARAAAERVRDGETVLLDAGTTVLELARALQSRRDLTVVTNSLPAAFELSEAGHAVVVIGGQLHPDRRATLGPLANEFLRDMHVDQAFIGVNGVSEANGWTVVDFDAVQIKRAMMARAREVIVMADHSKLGGVTFASIGPLNVARVLITDTPIEDADLRAALEKAGVETVMSEK